MQSSNRQLYVGPAPAKKWITCYIEIGTGHAARSFYTTPYVVGEQWVYYGSKR